MKKIIALILMLAPLAVAAQHKLNTIDISKEVTSSLRTLVSDSINDISHYSLVKGFRRANIVYTTKDSINVASLIQNAKKVEITTSPIVTADSIKKSLRAVYLPYKRTSEILLSTDSGKLTFSISSNEAKNWSKFTSYNYTTTSPIIYAYNNRLVSNGLIAYFVGIGNLTESDSIGKSMIFMITSGDGGQTWSDPKIALKHNLYSLNDASIALYSGRNNKKQELFMICSSKETNSTFLSIGSNDGTTWSYPMELPYLKGTENHIITINKNKLSLLFTDSNAENIDEYGDIFMILTSINDIKNQKMKGVKYKISDSSITEQSHHHKLNHSIGAMLYKPSRLMFTISSKTTDNSSSSIKGTLINVGEKRSKVL